MKNIILFIVLTVSIPLFILGASNKIDKILYSALNQNTKIIGSLGKPIGELIQIEGLIVDSNSLNTKSYMDKTLIKVLSVNGESLKKPVLISFQTFSWVGIAKPEINKLVKYIGYETGGMTGIPDKAFKYIPRVATEGYYFSVYFQVCKEVE